MKLSIITVVRHDFEESKISSIENFINNGAQWIVIDGGSDKRQKFFKLFKIKTLFINVYDMAFTI